MTIYSPYTQNSNTIANGLLSLEDNTVPAAHKQGIMLQNFVLAMDKDMMMMRF